MGEDASSGRMKAAFLTQNFNRAGIQAVKLYVRGIPMVIVVDDYLPLYNGGLLFNRMASDGSLWSVIMEKAFAKLNGNYEFINEGW